MNNNQIEKIEKILYQDDEFKNIESIILSKNNEYNILIKDNDELTFSKILKYYLDPEESHGLSARFLRDFLFLLIDNARNYNIGNVELSKIEIEEIEKNEVKVFREYSLGDAGRIDIMIEVKNKLLVLIENKITSDEGINQTNRYYDYAEENMNYENKLYAYITPDKLFPENENFIPLSFIDIRKIFKNEYDKLYNNRTIFIKNIFIEWLEDKGPMDRKLKDLCRSVYKNHREALEIIIENAPTISAFMKDISTQINVEFSEKYKAHSGSYWMAVSPKEWIKDNKLKEARNYSSIRLQLEYYPELIHFSLVIPGNDILQNKILEKCEEIIGLNKDEVKIWKKLGENIF